MGTELPITNTTDKYYDGLHNIIKDIDFSKTKSKNIAGGEVSLFSNKLGKKVLTQVVDTNGSVSYFYRGRDCEGNQVNVQLCDFDNDKKFDFFEETYDNGNKVTSKSSKDDGYYDEAYLNGKLIYKRSNNKNQ